MSNIEAVKNTIATCYSFKTCRCFDNIFNLKPFYNPENEQEYISENIKALIAYIKEYRRHLNKDLVYNHQTYTSVAAEVLKKIFDHHLQTLHLFQRYILKTLTHENIFYFDGYCESNVVYYVDTIFKLIVSYERTNRLFNQPYTPIAAQRHLDEIDFHLYTLSLFESFVSFQTLSKTTKTKQHGKFRFTREPNLYGT